MMGGTTCDVVIAGSMPDSPSLLVDLVVQKLSLLFVSDRSVINMFLFPLTTSGKRVFRLGGRQGARK